LVRASARASSPMKKITTIRRIRGKRTRIQDNAVYPLWQRTFSKKVHNPTNRAFTNKLLTDTPLAVITIEITLNTKYTMAGGQRSIYLWVGLFL
jgi:hypothetical protein